MELFPQKHRVDKRALLEEEKKTNKKIFKSSEWLAARRREENEMCRERVKGRKGERERDMESAVKICSSGMRPKNRNQMSKISITK